jgi:hypothetical protein
MPHSCPKRQGVGPRNPGPRPSKRTANRIVACVSSRPSSHVADYRLGNECGRAHQGRDRAARRPRTVVVGVGPGKSLAAKVAAIQGYLVVKDTANACATLNALINEVNAQTGKKISTALAASLISRANDIQAALDC